jgi:hypothetical protein
LLLEAPFSPASHVQVYAETLFFAADSTYYAAGTYSFRSPPEYYEWQRVRLEFMPVTGELLLPVWMGYQLRAGKAHYKGDTLLVAGFPYVYRGVP